MGSKADSYEIAKGVQLPIVGLGLWQMKDAEECEQAVTAALKVGYRHFDTAQIYGNEQFLGAALKSAKIPRKDLFITTKISINNFLRVNKTFASSLEKLQTDYVDLLLLHFPLSIVRGRAWKDLEAIQAEGMAKSIGVSNYTIRHLEQLLKECNIKPAVNQVELHVYLQQPELLAYCAEHGITVEAYSPLAHGYGLDNEVLAELAKKYKKTPAQIMLRWCIEKGTVPLPKSVNPERISENFNVFDFALTEKDMQKLTTLNKSHRTCWDPTLVP
jgi:diketogulonate reductase-like aldo/keto reductase